MTQKPLYENFKWTFSTLGCSDLTLEESCLLAKKFGLKHIEVRSLEDRVDLPDYFAGKYGSPENLKSVLDDHGVQISTLNASLKMVGNTKEDREEFLKFVPWAEAIDTPLLRAFDGGTPQTILEGETLEQAVDTLRWWQELRAKNSWNVKMAVETHDCLCPLDGYDRIKNELGKDFTVIWDSHHTWKKSGVPIKDSWEHLKSSVPTVHLKDSVPVPSARHPFSYTTYGEGTFPLNETLETLKKDGYDGFVCIEWERKWHPYLAPLDEALQKAKDLNWF
ncbi:sugar phosphate isomerase/epimerase [Puniceicoccaceae bacterium K14]|nr:sugar phosphate isomerase/epimerase [Puniceicoccaceae bacterium K14]